MRWVGAVALAALILWQALACYVERPLPAIVADATPSCGAIVDERYRAAAARARGQLESMMRLRRIPGIAIAVGVHGRIVYREGLGYADLDTKEPACPHTRFRAASLSKLFTAAAMARLVEQGRLEYSAPIQRYVSTFPDKGATITPALLASHRAGIRSYRDDSEAINLTPYASVTASLEKFKDDPLVSVPGRRFHYSSYGYVLLSAAIEGAANEAFLAHIRRSVFEPLAMNATVPDLAGATIPDRAAMYDVVTPYSLDGSRVRSPPNDFSSKWGAGGFLTTVEDLVRFGSAHLPNGRGGTPFLNDSTLDQLFTPQSGLPPLVGYGLGWVALSDLHLRRVFLNFGASSGGTAMLAVFPGSSTVVAVMANLGHARFPSRALVTIANAFNARHRPDYFIAAAILAFVAFTWRREIRRFSASTFRA